MKKYKKLVFISLITLIMIGSSVTDFLFGNTLTLLLGIANTIIAGIYVVKYVKDVNNITTTTTTTNDVSQK